METVHILIPWFHPAYKAGGPIQSVANMVRQMEDEPVRFNILCSNKDLDGSILNVPTDQWVPFNNNTRIWYSSNNRISSLIRKEIKEAENSLLYIVGLYDWDYNFKPLLSFSKIQKIISVRGMLHPGALSQKSFKKKLYLQLWKIMGWHRKFLFQVTDEREKEYVLKQFGKNTKVAVADNFPLLFDRLNLPGKEPGSLKLVSIALIGPMKNHLLVLEALKAMGNRQLAIGNGQWVMGNMEYNIYGPVKEVRYWDQCLELIKEMAPNVQVRYHGAIDPSDIKEVLQENHVFILPSKSENFGHGIIEALSAGRPVITSQNTPWNGLESAKAGININSDNQVEMVNAIRFFLNMSGETLSEWSRAANEYAVKAVDKDRIREQYRGMFGIK